MRNLRLLLILMALSTQLFGQIQIRPLPTPGFEQRISDFISSMEIVDMHEHLISEESIKAGSMLDFMLLLHHYADDDIKSAGLGKAEFAELLTDRYTVKEKWEIVKPFWEASKNTAYGRVVLLVLDSLYGVPDLTDDTIELLSSKIRNSYNGAWYDTVLKDKAKIKYIVMDVGTRREHDNMFRYVEKFDDFIRVFSKEDIHKIARRFQVDITTLDAYEKTLEIAFDQALKRKIVGIKTALAYHRPLHYENVTRPVAQKIFDNIMDEHHTFDFEDVKPLQDYMMHRIILLARKHDLPMQIHTGLQAGDGNYISNANPALLTNLFLDYRDVNFLLMHGAYPYGGELSALAKGFRNVFIDMSWMYIISPSYSERYLHEWLETVPSNKILGFGGDYHNVENAYGHSLMARAIVAKVLIAKVVSGYLTEEEAKVIAKRILSDNAIAFFKIK